MFVRAKKHPNKPSNHTILVVRSQRIKDKVHQITVKHFGISRNEEQKNYLVNHARAWLLKKKNTMRKHNSPKNLEPILLPNIRQDKITNVGISEIFSKLFVDMGFNNLLPSDMTETLKLTILGRILSSGSKKAVSEELLAKFGYNLHVNKIYRMMDTLHKYLDELQRLVFNSTQSNSPNGISLMLYDVTTLHLETVVEDDLRAFGYSKNCRFNTTQLVLALATTQDGLPIGYRLFPGNTAETTTLLTSLNEWKKIIPIKEVVIVGDRAMMSKSNIQALEESNLQYVLAYSIRKAPKHIKEEIFSSDEYRMKVTEKDIYWSKEVQYEGNKRIIATYSSKRHKKDFSEREKTIERIRKKLKKSKKPKNLISNTSYLKYTKMEGNDIVEINEGKISLESQYDGYHAVITNSKMEVPEILQRYRNLWVIEESFRINKHDLKMRPIYHRKKERIESHIGLCYLEFALCRTLQFILKKNGLSISIKKIKDELLNTQASIIKDITTGLRYKGVANLTDIGEKIYNSLGVSIMTSLYEPCSA